MVNPRPKCWNCMRYFLREKNGKANTVCRGCYKHMFKRDGSFEKRDPFFKYRNELGHMNWAGLNRVRKPSYQVQAFFAKIYQIRRKIKMLFRLAVILAKLQKESTERAYAPGGLGFQYCQESFNSMALN